MRIRLTISLDLRPSRKTSGGMDRGDCVSVAQDRSEAPTGIGFTLPSTDLSVWDDKTTKSGEQ